MFKKKRIQNYYADRKRVKSQRIAFFLTFFSSSLFCSNSNNEFEPFNQTNNATHKQSQMKFGFPFPILRRWIIALERNCI